MTTLVYVLPALGLYTDALERPCVPALNDVICFAGLRARVGGRELDDADGTWVLRLTPLTGATPEEWAAAGFMPETPEANEEPPWKEI